MCLCVKLVVSWCWNLTTQVKWGTGLSDTFLNPIIISISCLPQNLMLECLYFSSTARPLYDDE